MYNFILDSEKKVKDKLEMLQSISDIQIATKLLEDVSKSDNVIDDHYQKLKCTITPIANNVGFLFIFIKFCSSINNSFIECLFKKLRAYNYVIF